MTTRSSSPPARFDAALDHARFDAPLDHALSDAALDGFADRIARARKFARASTWLRDRPFLIVTPLGASCAAELHARLLARTWPVIERAVWPDWGRTSAAIYVWRRSRTRLLRGLAYQAVWERLFPRAAAEVWVLGGRARHRLLAAAKPELRAGLPHLYPRLILPELAFPARLHPFHVPDAWEMPVAARVASSMASRAAVAASLLASRV